MRINVGKYEAILLRDTPFGIDGGAMFHIVPRVLWQRKVTPDKSHRVFVDVF